MMLHEYLLYSLVLLGLSGVVVFSFFYSSWGRNMALVSSYSAATIGMFGTVYLLLGNPIPLNPVTKWLYKDVERGTVVWFELIDKQSMTFLLKLPNRATPMLVQYPWIERMADQVTKADREMKMAMALEAIQKQKEQEGDKDAKPDQDNADAKGKQPGPEANDDDRDLPPGELVIKYPFDPSIELRGGDVTMEKPTRRGPRKPKN